MGLLVSATERGEVSLDLHAELYSGEAVAQAATAFARAATVTFETMGGYHRVRLVASDPARAERVAREFVNYALAMVAASPAPQQ